MVGTATAQSTPLLSVGLGIPSRGSYCSRNPVSGPSPAIRQGKKVGVLSMLPVNNNKDSTGLETLFSDPKIDLEFLEKLDL